MDSTMKASTSQADPQVAARLRPVVMLMASLNAAVAALLITTASLGASPLADTAYALIP